MTTPRFALSLAAATAAGALMIFGAGAASAEPNNSDYIVLAQHTGDEGRGGGHDDASHDDSEHQAGQGQRGGRGPGETSDRGHRSLEDIFRDVDEAVGEDEDSDRPEWAGGGGGPNDRGGRPDSAGSTRGTLFGDMYVILRDANGVPILNEDGYVQPIDADGNLIPLDEEGAPIDPTLALEVELGRLNVGRSPSQVLDQRSAEVITLLNSATAITTDAAGRLVLTVDGETQTIDSPLENLAIYVALMTQGTIPGVTDLPGDEYDHLVDGTFTIEDVTSAAAFLAAASDKATPVSLDAVAYINATLGINTTEVGEVTYSDMDYSTFSYDRSDTYSDVTVQVLVQQPDGSWLPTTVNIYEAVFSSADYSGTGTFSAFAQSVDDARAVINYLHEYELPATTG